MINLWWRWFPSCNIRVYYRMIEFSRPHPTNVRAVFLTTAFNKCSPREQKFLRDMGLFTELYL